MMMISICAKPLQIAHHPRVKRGHHGMPSWLILYPGAPSLTRNWGSLSGDCPSRKLPISGKFARAQIPPLRQKLQRRVYNDRPTAAELAVFRRWERPPAPSLLAFVALPAFLGVGLLHGRRDIGPPLHLRSETPGRYAEYTSDTSEVAGCAGGLAESLPPHLPHIWDGIARPRGFLGGQRGRFSRLFHMVIYG